MTITPPADRQEFFKTENLLGDLLENYVQSLKIIPKAKKLDRRQRQWVHLATVHKELLKLETPKGSRSLELQVCNCASSRQVPNQAALIRSRLFRIHSAAHVNWQRLVNCIAAATPLFKYPNANKILPEARGLIISAVSRRFLVQISAQNLSQILNVCVKVCTKQTQKGTYLQ